jgi:hypothetical protein
MSNTVTTEPAFADPVDLASALRAGKKIGPDATELLKQDHREALGLFAAYDRTRDASARLALVARICMALKAHMRLEEELFYPAVRDASDDDELIDDAIGEHDEAKSLVVRLEGRTDSDARLTRDVHALKAAVEQHVVVEEADILLRAKETVLDRLDLGRQMAVRRTELFAELTGKPLPQGTRD